MQNSTTLENVITRQTAKALFRQNRGLIILLTLIMMAITGGLQMLSSNITAYINSVAVVITQYEAIGDAGAQAAAAAPLPTWMGIVSGVLSLVISVGSIFLTAPLTVGSCNCYLRVVRGEKTAVKDIFSRMGTCLKAVGVQVLVGLITFVWMLPGITLMILGMTIGLMNGAFTAYPALMVLLMVGAFLLMMGLALPAAFRYCMANFVLAEQPECGVMACLAESKRIMKGRKWQYFRLGMYYLLIVLGVLLGGMLIMALCTIILFALTAEIASPVLVVILTILPMLVIVALYVLAMYLMLPSALASALFYRKAAGRHAPIQAVEVPGVAMPVMDAPAADEAPAEDAPPAQEDDAPAGE